MLVMEYFAELLRDHLTKHVLRDSVEISRLIFRLINFRNNSVEPMFLFQKEKVLSNFSKGIRFSIHFAHLTFF